MKLLLQTLKKQLQDFMEKEPKPVDISLKSHKITTTIRQAQERQLALHAIYDNQSFTGDLVKYDMEQGKLILKNFQENISTIIAIDQIDKLSLVPATVRNSQRQNKSKK